VIKIRKAGPEDLATLRLFEQDLIRTERPFDPTLKKDPINYYDLEKMMGDPDVELVVAEEEGKIIGSGYALIKKAKHYLDHENYAYLGFMYVLPGLRGQGVNALIIDRLMKFARAKGLSEIRLEVYEENESAIKAYEKSGFEKHLITMRTRIQ